MDFIQKNLACYKRGHLEVCKKLHDAWSIVKSLNSSVLVCIIIMEEAVNIKDFKHISLVGSIYKLIARY